MPDWLKRELYEQGRKKGLTGERLEAYVYGALRRAGWKPSREKKKKRKKKKKHHD